MDPFRLNCSEAMSAEALNDPSVQAMLRDPQNRNITITINNGPDQGRRRRDRDGRGERFGGRGGRGGLLGLGGGGLLGRRGGARYDNDRYYEDQDYYGRDYEDRYGREQGGRFGRDVRYRGRGGGLFGRGGGRQGDGQRRGLPIIGLLQQGISSAMNHASSSKDTKNNTAQSDRYDLSADYGRPSEYGQSNGYTQSSGYADSAPRRYDDAVDSEKRRSA